MVADAPSDCALLARSGGLVGLTLDAKVHDVVAADGAVVNDDVPSPESNGVPLLDLEALLAFAVTTLLLDHGGRIGHVDVGHSVIWRKVDVVLDFRSFVRSVFIDLGNPSLAGKDTWSETLEEMLSSDLVVYISPRRDKTLSPESTPVISISPRQ